MECTRCKEVGRKILCKQMCCRCYYATKRGKTTITERLSERNFIRGDVGILTATDGTEFIIDIDDFNKCKDIFWYHTNMGYAKANKIGYLHRYLCQDFDVVDHINRNKKDNRKENLREGRFLNSINKSCKLAKTGFRGVHESRGKFEASLTFKGKRYRKSGFSTIQEAHQKVLEIAKSLNIEEYYLSV